MQRNVDSTEDDKGSAGTGPSTLSCRDGNHSSLSPDGEDQSSAADGNCLSPWHLFSCGTARTEPPTPPSHHSIPLYSLSCTPKSGLQADGAGELLSSRAPAALAEGLALIARAHPRLPTVFTSVLGDPMHAAYMQALTHS